MKYWRKIISILLHILLWYNSVYSLYANTSSIPDSLLTEKIFRNIYIHYPDSALHLLEEAANRKTSDIRPWRIDWLRAMCHEIKSDFVAEEQCCRLSLQHDSIRLVPQRRLTLLLMLAGTLERRHQYEEAITISREGIDLARSIGSRKHEAELFNHMARTFIGMHNKNQAENCFRTAIERIEKSDDVKEMSILSHIYGEYMTFLIDHNRLDEGIDMGYQRQELIQRMSHLPGPPPGYIDQQYAFLYAKMAVMLYDAGDKKRAENFYSRFQETHYAQTTNGRNYILPYLEKTKRYTEMLRNAKNYLNDREVANDTLSYDYLQTMLYLSHACQELKQYPDAYAYLQRSYHLRDSLYIRENKNQAQEPAARFELKEKELLLAETQAKSERRIIIAIGLAVFTLLLTILMGIIWRNLQKERTHNRIAARQMEELMEQREELRRKYAQTTITQPDVPSRTIRQPDDAGTIAKVLVQKENEQKENDYALFMQIENIMMQQKLFLNPGFGRDDLIAICGIGKNELPLLLRTYAHADNFNDYLNRLKVEYAVTLLKEKSDQLTIDAIAKEANFTSKSTFYRAFAKQLGMTPAQYLKSAIH